MRRGKGTLQKVPFLVVVFVGVVAVLPVGCNPGKGKTAYVGATLWDGTGGSPVANAVVLVDQSGHVERAGPRDSVRVPRGATQVQLDGKWIIPGLIDARTHAARWTLAPFLAYGVTAIRDAGGPQDSILALRQASWQGSVPGPRLYVSGAAIDAGPGALAPATLVQTTAEARKAVDVLTLADASFGLVNPGIDSTMLAAIMDEASTVRLPVAGLLGKVDALRAAQMGVGAIEALTGVVEATASDPAQYLNAHDDFYEGWNLAERAWAELDSTGLQRTAEALARAGVAIVPALGWHQLWAHLEDSTYLTKLDLAGVPPSVQRSWDVPDLIARARLGYDDYLAFRKSRPVQDRFVHIYHRLGGLVAAGSDAGGPLLAPGAALHDELALLVAAGLTPGEALLAATRDAARLLRADSLGAVREGAVADFVILSASPLDAIANTRKIEGVVSRGVYRTEAQLRALWTGR
jgi:imidazolonepropionase-like amidohydrolase